MTAQKFGDNGLLEPNIATEFHLPHHEQKFSYE
jgi:hypothetical protein